MTPDADALISGEFHGSVVEPSADGNPWADDLVPVDWRWLDIGGGGPVEPAEPGAPLTETSATNALLLKWLVEAEHARVNFSD